MTKGIVQKKEEKVVIKKAKKAKEKDAKPRKCTD
jgi:hypothetical protein